MKPIPGHLSQIGFLVTENNHMSVGTKDLGTTIVLRGKNHLILNLLENRVI